MAAALLRVFIGWTVLLCSGRLVGAAPFLVADINTHTDSQLGSNPRQLVAAGGLAYFVSYSSFATNGTPQQLWRTDGTAAGTFPVTDFQAGDAGNNGGFESLTAVGEKLFFFRDTRELWVTDGTLASTRRLHTFDQDFNHSMVEFRGELYFVGCEPGSGRELWRSNGTVGGTFQVIELEPGYEDGLLQGQDLHVSGDELYFVSSYDFGSAIGAEPWVTDGTAIGTRIVANLAPGASSSNPSHFVDVGGKTLFRTSFLDQPGNLWATEGTPESTVPIADVDAGELFSAGEYAIFFPRVEQTGFEPWVTDGTPGGTGPLLDLTPGPASSFVCSSELCSNYVAVAGGFVYFSANVEGRGSELFRTDGTAAGTKLVRDIARGQDSSHPSRLTAAGDLVFFHAQLPETQTTLWVTNGTSNGTIQLPAPPDASDGRGPVAFADGILFPSTDARGSELWHSDGTVEGTQIVGDLANPPSSSNPIALATLGRFLFFAADDGVSGYELWRTDGSAAGTLMLKDIEPGAEGALEMPFGQTLVSIVFEGALYFRAQTTLFGDELWRSDGTPEGTWLVDDLIPGPQSSYPTKLLVHEGSLFFLAARPVGETTISSVFRSDGSETGTIPIFDLPGSTFEVELVALNGFLYFAGGELPGLWRSNGTAEGTELLPIEEVDGIRALTPFGGELIFRGYGSAGSGLWASDGTVAATRLLRAITFAGEPFFPSGDYLYFIASSNRDRVTSLWRTDGTSAGTRLIAAPENFFSSNIANLTTVGQGLAFSAYQSFRYGAELWMVRPNDQVITWDIIPGEKSSSPGTLIAVGETLLFSADDGVHGQELWISRAFGMPSLFFEFVPGRTGSNPEHGRRAGNFLYFSAEHPDSGRELWAVPVADVNGPVAACVGDCNSDGAVTVDELTTAVNIALGTAPQTRCAAIDRDASGTTSVDEIVTSVERALLGCAVSR